MTEVIEKYMGEFIDQALDSGMTEGSIDAMLCTSAIVCMNFMMLNRWRDRSDFFRGCRQLVRDKAKERAGG